MMLFLFLTSFARYSAAVSIFFCAFSIDEAVGFLTRFIQEVKESITFINKRSASTASLLILAVSSSFDLLKVSFVLTFPNLPGPFDLGLFGAAISIEATSSEVVYQI